MDRESEIAQRTSCLNQAADDEPLFVLRANDELAPGIVRLWASRYYQAKSAAGELTEARKEKYREALALAQQMEDWKEGSL